MEETMTIRQIDDYIVMELDAIYEEFDKSVNQLILLRKFLKDLLRVSEGKIPLQSLNKIISETKKRQKNQ